MKNLAGDERCDREITRELARSIIDAIPYDPPIGRYDEVPSRLRGKLGQFMFRRAWYYWVVDGPVPLEVARELYADPVGVTDIRIAGHCGCPPPESPWISWITDNGSHVRPTAEREQFESLAARYDWDHRYVWSDDPAAIGKAYVTNYHIDSEVGLRLFADTLRKHGLNKIERPWWDRKAVGL